MARKRNTFKSSLPCFGNCQASLIAGIVLLGDCRAKIILQYDSRRQRIPRPSPGLTTSKAVESLSTDSAVSTSPGGEKEGRTLRSSG
jgi:hypothetical protein